MGMVDGTMLGDTPPRKLDPRSLTSEERAIVDNCALYYRRCNNDEPAIDGETVTWAYVEGLEKAEPFIILARRAIFGEPASEPAKVETEWHPCKNCGQLTLESPDRPLYNDHLCQYPCEPAKVECPNCGELTTYPHGFKWDGEDHYRCSKPAQPEPVAEEMPEAVSVNTWQLEELLKYADLAEVSLRTGFHPPEFLFEPADRSLRQCIDAIKEQRDQWRTHSAQPAKVGMTEEWWPVIHAAENWLRQQKKSGLYETGLPDAIAAVRAQAAEEGKVRMPKVRSYFLSLSMLPEYRNDQGRAFLAEVKAELDAAEGVRG